MVRLPVRAKVALKSEQAVPQGFGFPSPRRALEGEHGHPGEQVAGQLDDEQPDAILVIALQRQVGQDGVFCGADAVLTTGAAAVPHLQISQLASGSVGDEGGEPVAIDVIKAELGAGVGSFSAHDHSHPGGVALQQVFGGEEVGELDHGWPSWTWPSAL